MKGKIGIIAAMEEELDAIKIRMTNIIEEHIYELKFYKGEISNIECIVVKSGVGKVNAARTAQILISNYNVDKVINVGSAGALNDELKIGDIIIGEELTQYDFDITAFGHEKGYITDVGKIMYSDKKLIKICETIIENMNNNDEFNLFMGKIATGDMFCTDMKMKQYIRNEFNADCIEMEGAAIAQVCKLDDIDCLVIRAISDVPNGKNEIDFDEYLKMASERCGIIIQKMCMLM